MIKRIKSVLQSCVLEMSHWTSPQASPQAGRPVEVDSDQIETLIEDNQRYTTQEITKTLKISKSIKLLLQMKNVSFYGKN